MNESQIENRVKQDLESAAMHKDELQKIVITPHRENLQFFDKEDAECWVVASKDEYVITFDDAEGVYGLAFKNIFNILVYLGDEGSLAEAFDAYLSRNAEAAGSPRKSESSKKKSRRKKKPDPEPW